MLMGVQFPGYDEWLQQAQQSDWGWKEGRYPERLADMWWANGDQSEWN